MRWTGACGRPRAWPASATSALPTTAWCPSASASGGASSSCTWVSPKPRHAFVGLPWACQIMQPAHAEASFAYPWCSIWVADHGVGLVSRSARRGFLDLGQLARARH